MTRKYLKFYHDMLPVLDALSDAEAGRLLLAAIKYSIDGGEVSLPGKESILWPLFMSQIDQDKAKSESISETNRRNVTKRYDRIRTSTNSYDQNARKESTKEKNIYNNKKFIPPTLEEVKAYCMERGNHVDADRFYSYYESNGWRVGKNPMKDWKAAVRTWERSDSAPQKPKTSNIFLQMLQEEGGSL